MGKSHTSHIQKTEWRDRDTIVSHMKLHTWKSMNIMGWTRCDTFHMKFHMWNNLCFTSVFHEWSHIYKINHIFHQFSWISWSYMYKKRHGWSIAKFSPGWNLGLTLCHRLNFNQLNHWQNCCPQYNATALMRRGSLFKCYFLCNILTSSLDYWLFRHQSISGHDIPVTHVTGHGRILSQTLLQIH